VAFGREDDDHPETGANYGVCGWTKDDAAVVLYDEFDLWQITPKTGEAVCVTDGFGRATRNQMRYVPIEREQEGLPAELLLSATNQDTMSRALYRDWLDSVRKPARLFEIDKGLDGIVKAKKADRFFFTIQTFAEPPDLWTSDGEFHGLKKLSALNPQQKDFRWGKAELVHWIDGDGKPMRGILIKPDGFDPKQQYPMLVYFYEKMSNTLHHYVPPAPGTSPCASYYVSNGYLFFMPDITYEVGYPGASCVKCVVSGVQSLIAQGFVDPKGIGASGHSWGGYQTAFLVTRTNIFHAVESGAPVSNMISAYGGIRYSSGVSRQFQYERTQSRIGGTPWEYPLRYWENSPIFFADKVNTPVLIMANDNDGAVPWTQGIEYFMALRRLGKEAYLFNYTGEDHGLGKRQNMKDWTRRMAEYFDCHLRGAPMAKWMKDGVPFSDREKEKLVWASSYQDITHYVDKMRAEAKAAPAVAPAGEPAAAEAAAEPGARGVGGDPSPAPGKSGPRSNGGGDDANGNGEAARAAAPTGLQPGAPAPDFAVADQTGKVRSLKEFAGKKVLLWFFPRANTPGCTAEGCAFRDNCKEFEAAGTVLVGASVDPIADNRAFHDQNSFPFPLLCDPERKLAMAYGACADAKAPVARRNAVLIDGKGRILKTWERVDAHTFPAEVLNELRAPTK
jgi:peroxiredoxin/dienelactone hydrolase